MASEEPLPPGWTQQFDPNHQTHYYFNTRTGESAWTRPEATPVAGVTDFEPCESFSGPRPGYVYTTGLQGTGYYSDASASVSAPSAASAPAPMPAPAPLPAPRQPMGRGRGATMPAWMAEANRANPLATVVENGSVVGDAGNPSYQAFQQREAVTEQPAPAVDRTGTSAQVQTLNALLDRIEDVKDTNATEGAGAMPATSSTMGSAHNWVKHNDPRSGRPYYYNVVTNETRWEEPEDYVEPSSMPSWQPANTAPPAADQYSDYSASASFNANSGRFGFAGTGSYWERMGRPEDREGRQMHTFFDINTLEQNRKEAEEKKKKLKNVDWRAYKEERKKRKRLMKERWLHED